MRLVDTIDLGGGRRVAVTTDVACSGDGWTHSGIAALAKTAHLAAVHSLPATTAAPVLPPVADPPKTTAVERIRSAIGRRSARS